MRSSGDVGVLAKDVRGRYETMQWAPRSLVEDLAGSMRRHCVIADDRVREVEAESYLVESVDDQRRIVRTNYHRRGNKPGQNGVHWMVYDGEEPRELAVVGQVDGSWWDERHEDGGWASVMERYYRS